ncbi:MAG: YbaB/EbfC family nucleoid-associated protein [Actinobacteria bacterium]|nr:YbaB/EbfC family nucleoid-associated protein [Actinomycetota bacterium]MCL6088273.1 YbaB/EbfC family nucleoid-associated protein [Actinomycetota bacterium]
MKQARAMQKQLEIIQNELKDMVFEASSGGGVVKVKVNGDQELLEVKINPEMVDASDIEMLEDMVMVAINDALTQSKNEYKNKMGSLAGGMNMPGLF